MLQVGNGCRACRFEMPAGSKWLLQAQQRLQRLQIQAPSREGSDRQAAREGPAASEWLQTITTCTYSSKDAAATQLQAHVHVHIDIFRYKHQYIYNYSYKYMYKRI